MEEQKKSGRVCTEQREDESESFQIVAQILSELVDTIRIKFNPHQSGNEEKLKRLKVAATEKVNQLREMTTEQVRMNIEFRCEQLRIPFSVNTDRGIFEMTNVWWLRDQATNAQCVKR